MKRFALMVIACAALPIQAVAQTTTPQSPPTGSATTAPLPEAPATTSTTPIDQSSPMPGANSEAQPSTDLTDPVATEPTSKKKNKKPKDAPEPRL